MGLREDIATDGQAAWFDPDGLAQTVTYTPAATGLGVSVAAVMQPQGENPQRSGRYEAEVADWLVPRAQVAAPANGDTITIGSEVWTVRRVKGGDGLGLGWWLECTREERAVQRGTRG